MRDVRLGIIGLGVGTWHLESFKATPGAEVIALCDIDAGRLNGRGDAHGIQRRYPTVQEMLADRDVDAVSVCLPNDLHAEVTVAALERGKHVLCEKPLASSVAEGRRLVAAARASRKTCMLAMKFRFTPEAYAISSELARGGLGEVYYGYTHYLRPPEGIPTGTDNWFIKKRRSGGGTLIDNGVHLLDLNWYLMGCPRPVSAYGATYAKFGPQQQALARDFDVEDFGCGLIRFENGASIYLDNAWAAMVSETMIGLRVAGTRGGATMWPFSMVSLVDGKTTATTPTLDPQAAQSEFAHFVECVSTGRPTLSPVGQGLEVLKMLDALYVSSATGKAHPIEAEPS